MSFLFARLRFPSYTDALTCSCRRVTGRRLSLTTRLASEDNADYKVNPQFINRNPRNLEYMNLAPKRGGWQFQAPRKDFYNRLVINISRKNVDASVEHFTGTAIATASSTEFAIRKQLYSTSDVMAAETVGRVLAQRCLEAGVTKLLYMKMRNDDVSEKMQAILSALKEADISLTEPEVVESEYKPGIDYEAPNRYGEKKKMKEDYQE